MFICNKLFRIQCYFQHCKKEIMASSLPSLTESSTDSGEIMDSPVEMQNSVMSTGTVARGYHHSNDANQLNHDNKEKNVSRLEPDLSHIHNTLGNNLRDSMHNIDFDAESLETNDDFSPQLSNRYDRSEYNSHSFDRRSRQFEYNEPNDRMSRRPQSFIDLNESFANDQRIKDFGRFNDSNLNSYNGHLRITRDFDRRSRSSIEINEIIPNIYYDSYQNRIPPMNDIELDTDIYLTPASKLSHALQQKKRVSTAIPKTKKQRKISRYDDDHYALPDISQQSLSNVSSKESVKVDINVNVDNKSLLWKVLCLLMLCLCIGIGAGVVATVVFLNKEDTTGIANYV